MEPTLLGPVDETSLYPWTVNVSNESSTVDFSLLPHKGSKDNLKNVVFL